MKCLFRTASLIGAAFAFSCAALYADAPKATAPAATSQTEEITQDDIQKLSEALGHFIGSNLNTPGIKFDLESVIKGIRDAAAGKPAPMADKEYEEKMMKLQRVTLAKVGEKNLLAANEFMAKNAKEPNIVVVEEGKLQYQVLQPGNGAEVKAGSKPLINYTGQLQDGTVFGRSADAGGPITLPLDETIPGFKKGIIGMKEGEKRRLYIHPEMGYGTMGHLPPNSLLIFDIEVVKAAAPETSSADEDELLPLALEDDEEDYDDEEEDDFAPRRPIRR